MDEFQEEPMEVDDGSSRPAGHSDDVEMEESGGRADGNSLKVELSGTRTSDSLTSSTDEAENKREVPAGEVAKVDSTGSDSHDIPKDAVNQKIAVPDVQGATSDVEPIADGDVSVMSKDQHQTESDHTTSQAEETANQNDQAVSSTNAGVITSDRGNSDQDGVLNQNSCETISTNAENITSDRGNSDQDGVLNQNNCETISIDAENIKSDETCVAGADKSESDQDKVKIDQKEFDHPSGDSQATEIIDSDSHDSQGMDSDDRTPGQNSDSDTDQRTGNVKDSGSDDDEKQYAKPWHNFWGHSSDEPAKKRRIKIPRKPSVWSARDTVEYRKGYPGMKDIKRLNQNLEFYSNEIPSYPQGNFIDIIHEEWWGKYQLLEYNHSYIQWLFPIRERGLNMHAQVLQLHEAESISSDPATHGRILKSYKMMLDFYGMELKDEKSGEVVRADNWEERFRHLNHSMHNYLRITRILKCLGEMKLEHLKAPFVRFVLDEIISKQTLYNCLDSCINYWLPVLRSDEERETSLQYAESLAAQTHPAAVAEAKIESKKCKKSNPDEETQPKLKQPIKKETHTSPKKEPKSQKKQTKITGFSKGKKSQK